MSEQSGRYQRSVSGMVGAMLILVLLVGGYAALRSLNTPDVPDPVQSVDYQSATKFARQEAKFPLLAPASLPSGWKATSVSLSDTKPQHWHLGCLTGSEQYVGLEQARRPALAMVADYVDAAATAGAPVDVKGESWKTYSDTGGDHALVRTASGVTTVVVGTAPQTVLEAYVATLTSS